MTNLSSFTRSAIAAVGAILLSAAFVTAAVGPAATAANGDDYAAVQTQPSVQEQQA